MGYVIVSVFLFIVISYILFRIYRYKKFINISKFEIDSYINNSKNLYQNNFINLYNGTTDENKALLLKDSNPKLYWITQKLLVATEDYLYKNRENEFKFWFYQFIEEIKLTYSLSDENINFIINNSINFLNKISEAFPNWKREYIFLNQYIHNLF